MSSRAARRRASAEGGSAGIVDVGLLGICVVHSSDIWMLNTGVVAMHVFVLTSVCVVRAGASRRLRDLVVFNQIATW
jgi:hypothetical protein